MSAVVGVLVALASVAVTGPGGRRWTRPSARRGRPAIPERRARLDLSTLLVDVSSQLRAGAAPPEAWSRVLGSSDGAAAPTAAVLLAATSRGGRSWLHRRADPGHGQRVRAVVAAARLSDELGAPLAGVLERIASAVAADEEAEGERRAALAGPRSTAQVLGWLPLLGLALGALLGADPVGVVLGGGLGTTSAVLGAVLLLVGRWWTAALLVRAGRAGDRPGHR